jgi:hypothetical protein
MDMHDNAKKNMDDFFCLFFFFFKRFIPSGISRTNCHLLIMDGHGFHATLKSTQDFGLVMITLPFRTSHTVIIKLSCCKLLKTTFKRERDGAMVKINYMELNKITLVIWVNKAFNQSLTKHSIKFGFKVCKIWPLNPKAMEVKTNPSNIYTTPTKNHSKEGEED